MESDYYKIQLFLEKNFLYRIYDKVLHLEVDEVQKELYDFIKIMIISKWLAKI